MIQMEKNETCIEDIFPEIFENGAFFMNLAKQSNELASFLQQFELNTVVAMDLEYVFNHSGRKIISILIDNLLKKDNAETLSENSYQILSTIVSNRYLEKWKKLFETLELDFDPISPYVMQIDEQTTDNSTVTHTTEDTTTRKKTIHTSGTIDHTDDVSRDVTDELTEDETASDSKSGNSERDTFGFNSSEEVPQTIESYTDTDETTRQTKHSATTGDKSNRTEKHINNETETTDGNDTRNLTESTTRENPTTRKLTRKGNIGNTTMQELVKQQREMLQWQFWNVVFEDMDTIVTCGVFKKWAN